MALFVHGLSTLPPRSVGSVIWGTVGLSVALHGGVIAAFLTLSGDRPPAVVDAVTVELVFEAAPAGSGARESQVPDDPGAPPAGDLEAAVAIPTPSPARAAETDPAPVVAPEPEAVAMAPPAEAAVEPPAEGPVDAAAGDPDETPVAPHAAAPDPAAAPAPVLAAAVSPPPEPAPPVPQAPPAAVAPATIPVPLPKPAPPVARRPIPEAPPPAPAAAPAASPAPLPVPATPPAAAAEAPAPGDAGDAAAKVASAAAALSAIAPGAGASAPAPDDVAAGYHPGSMGNVPPKYPYRARRLGFEGRVVLRVHVLPSGESAAVDVVSGSGHAILDRAAIRAVRRWRFLPATRGGVPAAGSIEVPITFRLKD